MICVHFFFYPLSFSLWCSSQMPERPVMVARWLGPAGLSETVAVLVSMRAGRKDAMEKAHAVIYKSSWLCNSPVPCAPRNVHLIWEYTYIWGILYKFKCLSSGRALWLMCTHQVCRHIRCHLTWVNVIARSLWVGKTKCLISGDTVII